jgi:hypothetical protein
MKTQKRTCFSVSRALLCACALLLPLASCNFFGIPDYTLTVIIEEGVSGTPEAGVHEFPELETVGYKYTPANSQHTVEVLIDGEREDAEASFTVYRSLTLVARLVDIRGAWEVNSKDASSNSTTFTVTLTGADLLGGAFSDSRGYAGTWTAVSNMVELTYGNWESYKYTGGVLSMSGTWSNGSAAGTWSASRVD